MKENEHLIRTHDKGTLKIYFKPIPIFKVIFVITGSSSSICDTYTTIYKTQMLVWPPDRDYAVEKQISVKVINI